MQCMVLRLGLCNNGDIVCGLPEMITQTAMIDNVFASLLQEAQH